MFKKLIIDHPLLAKSPRIEILKHGLFKLEIGKRYIVELNNGKVCIIRDVD